MVVEINDALEVFDWIYCRQKQLDNNLKNARKLTKESLKNKRIKVLVDLSELLIIRIPVNT